jgi:hypothetical protein
LHRYITTMAGEAISVPLKNDAVIVSPECTSNHKRRQLTLIIVI